MASLEHEALILLFRNRPELAPELLREALDVAVPAYSEARLESAELTDIVPAEYRADLVVQLVAGEPVLGIVIEVQLAVDPRKHYSWPVYRAGLRARLKCPACVLVVTPSERVAKWAATPIELGPGGTFRPLVLGPNAVPVIRDSAAAEDDPELAVLSAMAHGKDSPELALAVARAASAGVDKVAELDGGRAMFYLDLITASLGDVARRAFEGLMELENYVWQSDFAKKHYGRGFSDGEAQGKAQDVLAVLDARGLSPSDAQKQRILECKDLPLLDRWLRQAAVCETADLLFAD